MKVERGANKVLQQRGRAWGQSPSGIGVGRYIGTRDNTAADRGVVALLGERWRFRVISREVPENLTFSVSYVREKVTYFVTYSRCERLLQTMLQTCRGVR